MNGDGFPYAGPVDRAELIEYVRSQRDAVVASVGPDGAPQAAYLTIAATEQGELVFDAKPDSRKVANLRHDPRVAIVVGGRDGTTLQCEGAADLPDGDDLVRCAATYVDAFPEFAASVRGGDVVVIRVRLEWARYGDFRGSAADVRAVDLAATRCTTFPEPECFLRADPAPRTPPSRDDT